MSGMFCDGCGEGDLKPDPNGTGKRPVICDLCGWTADAEELSRKWASDDFGGTTWTKRDRKRRGRLFFLWVDFDPGNDDAGTAVMRLLGITAMSVARRTLIELDRAPSAETMRKLGEIPGVTRVWLAP